MIRLVAATRPGENPQAERQQKQPTAKPLTATITVVDRDGNQQEVEARLNGSLMETLRELDCGVMAICGGMCSCATCHIHVAPEWLSRLPAPQEDERALVSGLQHGRDDSRLACQITVTPEMAGLSLVIAPEGE